MESFIFDVIFWISLGIGVLIAVLMVAGMVFHFAVFGMIIGLIAKQIGSGRIPRVQIMAGTKQECAHCKSLVLAAANCPNCGAPLS